MQVGVDAGALCGKRFGNYIYTENLIKAIKKYDKDNKYYLYSFCNKKENLTGNKNIVFKILRPKTNWINWAVRIEELVNNKDVFLGLNQSFPKSKSKKIIFSHGLSFIFNKNLYPDSYLKMKKQVESMIKLSDYIIVSSLKVKKEFETMYGRMEKIKVISFGIPFDFQKKLKTKRKNYFLNVGMNHPIKNIPYLVDSFKKFNKEQNSSYKLYLVTDKKHSDLKDKNIMQLTKVSRPQLKKLYSEALGYLTSSLYESYNFPVIEALSQGCPVIGLNTAIIPEMNRFVNVVSSKKQFIENINNVSIGKYKKINIKALKKEFSWNKYISLLKKLY